MCRHQISDIQSIWHHWIDLEHVENTKKVHFFKVVSTRLRESASNPKKNWHFYDFLEDYEAIKCVFSIHPFVAVNLIWLIWMIQSWMARRKKTPTINYVLLNSILLKAATNFTIIIKLLFNSHKTSLQSTRTNGKHTNVLALCVTVTLFIFNWYEWMRCFEYGAHIRQIVLTCTWVPKDSLNRY